MSVIINKYNTYDIRVNMEMLMTKMDQRLETTWFGQGPDSKKMQTNFPQCALWSPTLVFLLYVELEKDYSKRMWCETDAQFLQV